MQPASSFRAGLMQDRVALVSGAGSGIGKAVALLLGGLGARLVLCGRRPELLEATAAELDALGAESLVRPMTIRDPAQVAALLDAAWSRFGRLDHLVNNAGGQFAQDAIDFSVKGWNAVIDTNLNGTWHMMQAAARRWRDAGQPGAIVNIVMVVSRGQPGMAHSCAARAGVIALSRTVAVEWAPLGIRVNCVAPGAIRTDAIARYAPEAQAAFARSNPMMRLGEADDVAEACCFLLAPSGRFVTGEVVAVDGGHQLWGDEWAAGRPAWYDPQHWRQDDTTPQEGPMPPR
ncbi:MAG: SDR family oxidoreductase [Dongiaceae bacterium]